MSERKPLEAVLPSYRDAADEKLFDPVQPAIFSLAGQTIYVDEYGVKDGEPAAAFQLNRGLASLSHATSEVTFERVSTITDNTKEKGAPAVPERRRHLYTLKHMNRAPGGLEGVPSGSPQYYIEAATSKGTIAHTGFKKSLLRKEWKALPLDMSGKDSRYRLPTFIANADSVFELSERDDCYCEWSDVQGNMIATSNTSEDSAKHELRISMGLARDQRDALVALWCLCVWRHSADRQPRVESRLEEGEFNLLLLSVNEIC